MCFHFCYHCSVNSRSYLKAIRSTAAKKGKIGPGIHCLHMHQIFRIQENRILSLASCIHVYDLD